jgi:hypothetical protein
MIKVFNGKWRGLGGETDGFGMLIDFRFREILKEFPGARLAVFMNIVLHSDEAGHSFPSYNLIEKETGYSRATIASALDDLCATLIQDHHILIRYRLRGEDGRFESGNHYIVFPSDQEVKDNETTVQKLNSGPEFNFSTVEKLNSKLNQLKQVKPDGEEIPEIPPVSQPAGIVKNQRALEALRGFEEKKAGGEFDLSAYPEQVRATLSEFCALWKLKPPAKIKGKGGEFALWVSQGRELNDALGEWGLPLLREVFRAWQADPKRIAPARPGSILWRVQAVAGAKRREGAESGKPDYSYQQESIPEPEPALAEEDPVAAEKWAGIRDQLKGSMNKGDFGEFIEPARAVSYERGVLTIEVESEYAQEWCQSRLGKIVWGLLSGLTGEDKPVIYFTAREEEPL